MKSRHFISTAVVLATGVLAACLLVGGIPVKPTAIADDQPAATQPKTANRPGGEFSPYVDKHGQISLPQGYKQKWTHLGSWARCQKAR